MDIKPAYDSLEQVKSLFREYADALNIDLCFQEFDSELDGLPGRYALPKGRLYLAYWEGAAAGCAALKPLSEERCELKRLFVRPRFRGLKIGRALVERIIGDAAACGYRELVLDTLPRLTGATALYEKLGFRPVAPYYDNPIPDALFFGLVLK
ncbi:MAG: GNAT family N-acetyltransferase [Christensenellales bacterium]